MRLPFCFVNRNNVILPRGIGFLEEKRKITLGILVCEKGNYLGILVCEKGNYLGDISL